MVSKVWSSRNNKVQGSLSGCKIPQSQTKSTPENKTRRQANMAENVRVAVRVRPFSREKARNASLIINMVGSSTKITDPEAPNAEPKKFAFDFSYWSHDCFKELDNGYLEPTDSKYADQKKVFDDLGQGVLENAWKGYNCSLFAYGQTGSGKSYSMVGYGANKGIVPIFCETLFKEIDEKKNSGEKAEYQVALSMLEIYNEQVRDLLNPASNKKGGLKVRQHPNKGFYVESLVTVPVKSYADIDNRIEEGTKSRTVAATNMNATSSRAHTIVAINFSQKSKNEAGQNMTKTSIVNLVDLAGSERAESTGATGDRLKEGSAINQSLSMLGNCIKALADQSMGKKNVLVPFRDSVLTKLLKNALGGNSKTIMIAALSPADINYEETLSTLRFADRAKSIKTKAIINESPTDKLIRELREENARLLEQIKKGGVVYVQGEAPEQQLQPGGPSEEEMEEMKREMEEQLRRNQSEMEQMEKSWKERLMETEAAYKAKEEAEKKEKEMRKTTPHFWNLNEDPQLSNMIVHFIKPGSQRIGNRKADPPADITLSGLSILPDHAAIKCEKTTIKIKPSKNAKLTINGKPCTEETELHHNDRVMFGSSNLFVVHHPTELDKAIRSGSTVEKITYDMAQEEIAQNSGFNMDKTGGKSNDELLLQEDLLKLVPMVNEANAMSEELGKKVKFELMLISPQARGLKEGRTEVKVKMKSTEDYAEWVWDRNKFFNRKYLMQEMYQNYVEGEEDWDKTKEEDPFWEPDDVDVMIGTVQVYLQSLAYNIELEENLAITDHRGEDKGHLQVDIFPCDEKGNEDIDDFVEEPEELVGKNLNFNLKIPSARGLPQRFSKGKTYCSFKFYLEKEASLTQTIENTINPNFAYKKRFSYSPVTKQFLDYLQNQPLVIEVWGKQVGRKISKAGQQTGVPKAVANKKALQPENTQALQQKQTANGGPAVSRTATMSPDEQRTRDLQLTKSIKRADRSERKLKKIREMVEEAKKNNNTSVPVSEIEDILNGEGGKFKATASVVMTTSKAAAENDGKITSAACAIQ